MSLDLRPVSRKLDELHQRFIDSDLDADLQRDAFTNFDPQRYPPGEIARGKAAWRAKVLQFEQALIVGARFLADLAEMGTSGDIQGVATRLVRDRQRHVELARRLVVALGGTSNVSGDFAVPPRGSRAVRVRVLHAMVGPLCVDATIGARLLSAMAKQTYDPLTQRIIQLIAGDVAIHSRLGWLMLEVVVGAFSDRDFQAVNGALPRAFADAERRWLPTRVPAGTKPAGPTHSFGSLDAAHRQELFEEAAEKTAGRLEQLRLPGRKSYRERFRAPPQR